MIEMVMGVDIPESYIVVLLAFSFPAVVGLMAWIVKQLMRLSEANVRAVDVTSSMQENQRQMNGELKEVVRQVAGLNVITGSLEARIGRAEQLRDQG